MDRLNVKALAVAAGVSWGGCMLLAGWAAALGWGVKFVEVMGSVYLGFAPSFLGGILGAVWGFVDGAIGGAVVALVYNLVSGKSGVAIPR